MSEIAPGVSRIAPDLYQGALSCVVRHWDAIKDQFDWVVLAAEEIEPLPRGTHHLLIYPVPDTEEGLSLNQFFGLYGRVALGNGRLLCVCHMGENRSGLACVMALTQRGMPVEEAITLVRAEGNRLSPDKPHSFWNEGFANQARYMLKALELLS